MENRAHVIASHLPQPPGGPHPQQESRAGLLPPARPSWARLPGVRSASKTNKTDGRDTRVVYPQSSPQSKAESEGWPAPRAALPDPSAPPGHPAEVWPRSTSCRRWEGKPQAVCWRQRPGARAVGADHGQQDTERPEAQLPLLKARKQKQGTRTHPVPEGRADRLSLQTDPGHSLHPPHRGTSAPRLGNEQGNL